jgi:ribosomal-protein-alanine N-acetyltransferase
MITTTPHIRWIIRKDLPAVLQIENDSYDQPWAEQDFVDAMRDRNTIGMVAEFGEEVVGFMVYQLRPHSVYVYNLAVAPARRRLGVGEAMIGKLKGKLRGGGRTRICFDMPETNVPAQLFLRAQGFLCVRQDRGMFGEDGYRMQYRLEGITEE